MAKKIKGGNKTKNTEKKYKSNNYGLKKLKEIILTKNDKTKKNNKTNSGDKKKYFKKTDLNTDSPTTEKKEEEYYPSSKVSKSSNKINDSSPNQDSITVNSCDSEYFDTYIFRFLKDNENHFSDILNIPKDDNFFTKVSFSGSIFQKKLDIVFKIIFKVNKYFDEKKPKTIELFYYKTLCKKYMINKMEQIPQYIESQIKTLKNYKKRYFKKIHDKAAYRTFCQNLNLIFINDYFWYLYILPKNVLLIFDIKLEQFDYSWTKIFISDIIKYFIDIKTLGVLNYFNNYCS